MDFCSRFNVFAHARHRILLKKSVWSKRDRFYEAPALQKYAIAFSTKNFLGAKSDVGRANAVNRELKSVN